MRLVKIPTIVSDRFFMRAFQDEDVQDLYAVMQNPEVLRYFPTQNSPSMEQVRKLVRSQQKHWDEHGYGWWALAEKGSDTLFGWCGLNYLPDSDEVELKYLLAQPYWGKGIATGASLLSLDRWISDTEIDELIGLVHPENIASQRVLEKVGMSFINEAQYFGMNLLRYTIRREEFLRSLPGQSQEKIRGS
jgi:ribosomal-protein-alanine N-acetyltransferase